jgi:hypothetical protein
VCRNAASSWAQSGHLEGRTFKKRRKVVAPPATAAFAIYLDYRDAYFSSPEDLQLKLDPTPNAEFTTFVAERLRAILQKSEVTPNTVVAVLGAGSIFGFARVSQILKLVEGDILGRLVVFFPGQFERSNYRLLDARDGWNYLAVPIKQLDSHVIIVGAGQSALTDVPLLQKLMDRFTIRVPLSDAEVETVTRKVLLQKKPSAVADIRALLDKHAGEVARQLQGTRISESIEDRAVIVDDYPLLPVRRRFWENCFRQIDAAGTNSQLRSQLRIIHDALAKVSERPLGSVIPADELFEALAPDMVITGVLLREINERIIQIGRSDGPLAQRICGLVFLIGKLKREAPPRTTSPIC